MATDQNTPAAPARPERRVLAAIFVTTAAVTVVWEFFAAVLPPAPARLPFFIDDGRNFEMQHPVLAVLPPLSVWLVLKGRKLKLRAVKALSAIKGKSLFFKLLLGLLLLLGGGLIIGGNLRPATPLVVGKYLVMDCGDGHCDDFGMAYPLAPPPEEAEPPAAGDRVSALAPGASSHGA